MRNIRFAFRTLFRAPFVTIVAITSLAFGIGSTAAIFSLFDQVLLRPLPVHAPEQLVNLASPGPKPGTNSCTNAGECDTVFSYPMFRDLEREQASFTGIAAHRLVNVNLAYHGQVLSTDGMTVSGSYFPVLGLTPALGRLLGAADDRVVGESHVVVLGYDYWRTRLGGSPDVLNQTMTINGQSMTIVGVAPRGFDGTTFGATPQVFVPITMQGVMQPGFKGFDDRRNYWMYLFARLKPGVTIETAGSSLNGPYHAIIGTVEAPLQKGLSAQTQARFNAKVVTLAPGARGQSTMHEEAKVPLVILICVTGVVLMIACANIANLLLARSARRAGEMAIRLSIGASRGRLIRQLLLESCLLGALGGAAGLIVAEWTLSAMSRLMSSDLSQAIDFHLEPPIVLFAAVLAIGTGVLFGLFPALHSTRPELATVLKGQSGQPAGTRSAKWFRITLATAQIALSMALLAAAGLFARSLVNVSRVDLGIKVDNLIAFGIAPELNGYTPERAQAFFARVEQELAAAPGVTNVVASRVTLLDGDNWGSSVSVQGFPSGPDVDTNADFNQVGPGYFRALGTPLISGREFTDADRLKAPKVAIVNEAFADKFRMGRDVVGKLMATSVGNATKLDITIVGFVQNSKYSEVKGVTPPLFFLPYKQDDTIGAINFYVRTALDPVKFLPTIPAVIAKLDATLPVEDLRTMPQQVRENVFLDRMISTLSAAFAGLATLLAMIGLYGVLAYTVAQRTREFGLRMALGADPRRILVLVFRLVAWMTVVGAVVGLAGAIALGRFAQSLLYQLTGYDPVVMVVATTILTAVALSAGFIPARRASRTDPMTALRYE